MNRALDAAVGGVAARQASLFSRRQVLGLGGSDSFINRRLAAGWWSSPCSGIYRIAGAPAHRDHELWLAVLRVGDRAVISHLSAAALHGFPGIPRPDIVTVNAGHPGCRRLDGITVRQLGDIDRGQVAAVRGLPVTTPVRTLLDIAADLGAERVGPVAQDLVIARRVHPLRLSMALGSMMRPGKRGVRNMADVVDLVTGDRVLPESELERQLRPLVYAAAVGDVVAQMPHPANAAWRVDFGIRRPKVLVEGDGRRWHARMAQMARDKRRDQLAAAAGWVTLRFEWEQVVEDPASVRDNIAAVCSARRRSVA